jgi:hypothetical protein
MFERDDWNEFYDWLMATYWPCLPPDQRRDEPAHPVQDAKLIPVDIWRAAVMIFPDPEAWIQNPIPNFNNRTALELIAEGKLTEIRKILVEVSSFMLPDPSQLKPWKDGDVS